MENLSKHNDMKKQNTFYSRQLNIASLSIQQGGPNTAEIFD